MTHPVHRPAWRRAATLVPVLSAVALFALACSSNNNSSNNSATTAATQAATKAAASAATPASATAAAASATSAAASPTKAAAAATPPGKVTKIAYVPNWFAEPENGGELMAKLLNYFPPDLDVEIRDGGPGVNATPLLVSNQIQFTLCSGDSILTLKEQGIDLVGVMAAFQDNPQVLISHQEAGIKGFEDMKGKALSVSEFQFYYPYLQKKYGWNEADKLKYDGSVAPFLADKKLIEQGYYTAEPYLIGKENQKIDIWLIAKTGFDPYASLLCTTKDYAQKNPDVVREFVQAAQKGWQAMLKPENQKILTDEIAKRNKQEDAGSIKYALDKMPDLMFNDDTKANGFGHMSDERFKTLMDQLVDTKVLKGPVDYKSVFTNDFLAKGTGFNTDGAAPAIAAASLSPDSSADVVRPDGFVAALVQVSQAIARRIYGVAAS